MTTPITLRSGITPVAAVAKGAVAGLVGTLAMDLLWYGRYRRDGSDDGFLAWEFSAGTTSYEQAGAPAQVSKRIAEGYLQRELPPESARTMNNAMHLLTGSRLGCCARSGHRSSACSAQRREPFGRTGIEPGHACARSGTTRPASK